MSKDIAIQVSDLTKLYGEILAVDHIDFEVEKGEIFGFLGPNGAGKTTTIRMLTGISKPTDGKASVLGCNIDSEIVEAKKYIGVVPEISNLYDELSGFDNLIFMAQLYGVPRKNRKARAEELLKTFGLYERKNSLFRTYSRGMKRALTIAAALIHEPKILFLDEPTVGLDVVAARSLRNLIGNLHQQGITIFLTTHYLEEADLLCDRIAIVNKGKIARIDTPEKMKTHAEKESIVEFSLSNIPPEFNKELAVYFQNAKVAILPNNKVRIYTSEGSKIYEPMVQFCHQKNISIESINSIKPSLEDAFIEITGLSPQVMAMEKGGK